MAHKSYKPTIYACYLGFFVQAIVVNLTPILFIPLKEQFGLSFGQLGLLVFINFSTQVIIDLAFSHAVDKYGFRPFVVSAHIVVCLGLLLFAMSKSYIGFALATVVFSAGGGLLELLLSPIVNAIPSDEKASAMSLLHSFYAWGQVAVVLITTLLIYSLGIKFWYIIPITWIIIPLINIFLFLKVPLAPQIPKEHRQGIRKIALSPFFIIAVITIIMGGASEQIIAQWSSAFFEKAINLPKIFGDIAGVCTFALMLGLGRLLYGIYGKRFDLYRVMIIGSGICIFTYLIIALTPIGSIALIACAITGFGVSLLWPGTLVLTADRFPLAGAWLFAILAAGGDIGASIGPWFTSFVVDNIYKLEWINEIGISFGLNSVQIGLRFGILASIIFPICAFLSIVWLSKHRSNS